MRLKVISYLSFWSRSKNKNMLWPFWSKDWGPEFFIAQPKVTAYLKSNHILSFITCSSDQTLNPKSTDSDMLHKIYCCFWSAQSEFLFVRKKKAKQWGCKWIFLTKKVNLQLFENLKAHFLYIKTELNVRWFHETSQKQQRLWPNSAVMIALY